MIKTSWDIERTFTRTVLLLSFSCYTYSELYRFIAIPIPANYNMHLYSQTDRLEVIMPQGVFDTCDRTFFFFVDININPALFS